MAASAPIPHRAKDPLASHHGAGPQNVNAANGTQTNFSISDSYNQQFNGPTTVHATQREIPPLPLSTVPFPRDESFVERPQLAVLREHLTKGGRRIALAGLGGVGKSQLAIECCYRLRDAFPETWVLWIHASSAARFDQDIQTLADDVKIPGRQDKDANIYQLVRAWLLDSEKTWLIVLDNADDADYLFEAAGNTRPRIEYLPACNHGSVLITTRHRDVARRLADRHNIIQLEPDRDHAIKLLRVKIECDDSTADRLAAALEYMPLAVAQAAAFIDQKTPRCSPNDYLAMLVKSDRSRSSLLKIDSSELRRDGREAKNAILLTWQISFEHIYRTRCSAADLLSLMSFYDHQGIPEMLLRASDSAGEVGNDDASSQGSAASTADPFETDIDILRDYSFVSLAADTATFQMHRLVQLAAQLWLKQKEQFLELEKRSLRKLELKFPEAHYEHWSQCRALYPHARLAVKSRPKEQDALLLVASILFKAACFADEQGSYEEAEAMVRQSLELREKVPGPHTPQILASVSRLGIVLQNRGKFEAAEVMHRRAMEARGKALGAEHTSTLTSVENLAKALRCQGKYEAAEQLSRRAFEGKEKLLGQEHPDTLTSMGNLAVIFISQGRWDEAEKLQVKAMEARRRLHGAEHPFTLTITANLARTYKKQGRRSEAAELQAQDLEICKRVLGEEHPDTLTSMNNLARTHKDLGQLQQAQDLMTKCVEARRRILGPDHPDTKRSISWLERMQSNLVKAGSRQ